MASRHEFYLSIRNTMTEPKVCRRRRVERHSACRGSSKICECVVDAMPGVVARQAGRGDSGEKQQPPVGKLPRLVALGPVNERERVGHGPDHWRSASDERPRHFALAWRNKSSSKNKTLVDGCHQTLRHSRIVFHWDSPREPNRADFSFRSQELNRARRAPPLVPWDARR